MKKLHSYRSVLSVGLLIFILVVSFSCSEEKNPQPEKIVGAWKGKVQFKTGAYSEIKDFEFMWVFNSGGTMTESSNYDGVPPTPPAYGIWKKTGDKQYEARYEFYWNKVPDSYEELAKLVGFLMPAMEFFQKKLFFQKMGGHTVQQLNLICLIKPESKLLLMTKQPQKQNGWSFK